MNEGARRSCFCVLELKVLIWGGNLLTPQKIDTNLAGAAVRGIGAHRARDVSCQL